MPSPWRRTPCWLPQPHCLPHSHRGGTFPHSSPVPLRAHPVVPSCLNQAGLGKHSGWLWDGHRELPMAAPKAPPTTRRSLALRSTPCRHARQESGRKTGRTRLFRPPKISSQGCEVTTSLNLIPFRLSFFPKNSCSPTKTLGLTD